MPYIVCTSNLDLVSFLFVPALYSTLKLEIFPFTCIYRDGGGGLALSVYIRKLSFSPSISGQMNSYLRHCDYTIKATIG